MTRRSARQAGRVSLSWENFCEDLMVGERLNVFQSCLAGSWKCLAQS